MSQSTENFIILCRDMHWEGLKPFGFDMWDNSHFIELRAIARKLTLRELYGHFLEHQYYIDLYAAIFVLDIFKLCADEKLTGNISVAEECFDIIKRYNGDFTPMQCDNYNHWSKNIKLCYNLI